MHGASIIISTYNGNQKWLLDAVDSYLNQKNVDIQLIISTVEGDLSLKTLKNYSEKIEFCVSKKPGIYYQLNNAIKLIDREWFASAAGDDIAIETKIFEEINVCLKNKKRICSSGFIVTDEKLNKIGKRGKDREYSLGQHLRGNFVSDCSLIHKTLIDEFAPFDLNCGNHGIWDFWIRVTKKYPDSFIFDKKPRWLYRQHTGAKHILRSKSISKIKKNEAERVIMMKKHITLLKELNMEFLLSIKKYK
jgi:glycosyltransferase involved in cell wall biosynthesis